MVYVKLCGRMGNNLFQLATGLALAAENNDELVAPHTDFYKFINFESKQDSFVPYSTYYTEPTFEYQKIPYTENMLITGYYQSEKYFKDYKDLIIEKFSLKKVYEDQIKSKYEKLIQENTVSLHVRRTDYLTSQGYHTILNYTNYYKTALEIVDIKDKKVVIFSDDIEWCKNEFSKLGQDNVVYMEKNLPIVDMFLMSYCKHNIIANSSFSWWATYFNSNPGKKVIAPANWFGDIANLNSKDIYCDGWEVI